MKKELIKFYYSHRIIINVIFWLIMAYFFGMLQDEHTK